MICAKHKTTYRVSCKTCDQEARQKEERLEQEIARINKKAAKKGEAPIKTPLTWQYNKAYEGREYTHEFRAKILHALQLIDTFRYGKMIDSNKSLELNQLFRSGRLDDVFKVAKNESVWTSVVKALGGRHGEAVYSANGSFLGRIQSYGCTTHSQVSVSDTGQATKDEVLSMMAVLDDSKVIYLHSKQVGTSTIVHELFHWFCHRDFYKAFGDPGVGKEWKTLNEGITEYFARMACNEQTRGAYQEEYDTVLLLMNKTDFSQDSMAKAYFGGDIQELVRIMSSGEYKQEAVASATGMDKVFDMAGRRKDRKKF